MGTDSTEDNVSSVGEARLHSLETSRKNVVLRLICELNSVTIKDILEAIKIQVTDHF